MLRGMDEGGGDGSGGREVADMARVRMAREEPGALSAVGNPSLLGSRLKKEGNGIELIL